MFELVTAVSHGATILFYDTIEGHASNKQDKNHGNKRLTNGPAVYAIFFPSRAAALSSEIRECAGFGLTPRTDFKLVLFSLLHNQMGHN